MNDDEFVGRIYSAALAQREADSAAISYRLGFLCESLGCA